MTIYIVHVDIGEYDMHNVLGVYTDLDLAKEYCDSGCNWIVTEIVDLNRPLNLYKGDGKVVYHPYMDPFIF
jgi:hypothetical protein